MLDTVGGKVTVAASGAWRFPGVDLRLDGGDLACCRGSRPRGNDDVRGEWRGADSDRSLFVCQVFSVVSGCWPLVMFLEPSWLKRQGRLSIARRKSRRIAIRTPLGVPRQGGRKRQQESIPFPFLHVGAKGGWKPVAQVTSAPHRPYSLRESSRK